MGHSGAFEPSNPCGHEPDGGDRPPDVLLRLTATTPKDKRDGNLPAALQLSAEGEIAVNRPPSASPSASKPKRTRRRG